MKSLRQGGPATPDFRVLFEAAPGLYLVLTPDLHIVAVSDAYVRATMTLREQILGRGIFEVFPDNPDDPTATGERNLGASLERVLRTNQADAMPVQKYDIRRPDEAGGGFEERYWSPVNSPVLTPDGKLAYIIHRVEDVTEFVRLKQAGQERERMAAVLTTRAEQMELEVYLRSQEVAEANRELRAANDHLASLYREIELLMRRAGDELTPAERQSATAHPMTPEEMLSRVGQLITDHKRLEDQLRQAQKLEAVGRLAGGVAHDFNNLLTVITGNAALVLRQLAGHPALGKLAEIEQAADRAAALTGQLLAFSRKQVLMPRIVDVNTVVTGVEGLLRRVIGEHITMLTVAGTSVAQVKVDPTQLELMIMNLAVNARDAMPDGGRLTIETGNTQVADGQVGSLGSGAYVVISVSDTGHGMDEATVARIFEPFFTTKAQGKGTGLGLATAYGIAEQSGGTLTVQSAPGLGATFRVYLPVAAGAVEEDVPRQATVAAAAGSATVLVVEDHVPLRELVEVILTDAGYRVLTAANGQEALHRSAGDSVDLVLTDIVMPGMSGPALVEQLSAKSQNLRVVFMSGYDSDLLRTHASSPVHYLQKPFRPESLLAKVAEVLSAEPATGDVQQPRHVAS